MKTVQTVNFEHKNVLYHVFHVYLEVTTSLTIHVQVGLYYLMQNMCFEYFSGENTVFVCHAVFSYSITCGHVIHGICQHYGSYTLLLIVYLLISLGYYYIYLFSYYIAPVVPIA